MAALRWGYLGRLRSKLYNASTKAWPTVVINGGHIISTVEEMQRCTQLKSLLEFGPVRASNHEVSGSRSRLLLPLESSQLLNRCRQGAE